MGKNIALSDITDFLDKTLKIAQIKDVSNNGLQIQNGGRVTKIAFGVDASLRTFKEAVEAGADLLVCHHGLSWGDSLKRITGLNYDLVSFAIHHDLAVYGAHLPLDAHPVYGNNAQLCKLLEIGGLAPAFEYHGEKIGFIGSLSKAISREAFFDRVRERITPNIKTLDFGKPMVRKIGVVSGGACEMIDQAVELGADLYLSGEPGLIGYTLAENLKTNAVFAGHYATETWGVKALKTLLAEHFKLPTVMFDFKITY